MTVLSQDVDGAEDQGPGVSGPNPDPYGGFAEQLLENLLSIPEPHAYFPLRGHCLDIACNQHLFKQLSILCGNQNFAMAIAEALA